MKKQKVDRAELRELSDDMRYEAEMGESPLCWAFNTLSPDDRQLMLLYIHLNYNASAVARYLKCSNGYITNRLDKIRKRVAARYALKKIINDN